MARKPIEAVSFRSIATVEQLELEQTDRQTDRQTHTHTHTQSALSYPSCGYASRHNNYHWNVMLAIEDSVMYVVTISHYPHGATFL